MKLKTLKKKIRRLEARLLEGPKKLAKLKGKLAALKHTSTAKSQVKPAGAQGAAPKKVKRKLNLSPERREQLAAAMRARWAAKRAAEATSPDSSAGHDSTIRQVSQSP